MTLAETLNQEACSCGLNNGRTWFRDSNGDEPTEIGEYTLFEREGSEEIDVTQVINGLCVAAVDIDGNTHEAVFGDDLLWHEVG